jgi:DNA-binding protein HU-beta
MNKSEFIDELANRYDGNRKEAEQALENVLDTITREVMKGEKVSITGFGSFEKRVRNPRWGRNPQTGERLKMKKKTVPKFKAGQAFKDVTSGAKKLAPLPKTSTGTSGSPTTAVKRTAAKTAAAKETAAKKTAAKTNSQKAGGAATKTRSR